MHPERDNHPAYFPHNEMQGATASGLLKQRSRTAADINCKLHLKASLSRPLSDPQLFSILQVFSRFGTDQILMKAAGVHKLQKICFLCTHLCQRERHVQKWEHNVFCNVAMYTQRLPVIYWGGEPSKAVQLTRDSVLFKNSSAAGSHLAEGVSFAASVHLCPFLCHLSLQLEVQLCCTAERRGEWTTTALKQKNCSLSCGWDTYALLQLFLPDTLKNSK